MNITSATIREQGRDSNYTPIHARVAMNPYSQIPKLLLLHSSSSSASSVSYRLPLSAWLQKCLIATWVCADCLQTNWMLDICDGISLLLFVSLQLLPSYIESERKRNIRIYMLDTFIYTALYAGKPVYLTINHTRLFLQSHHPALRFFYPWSVFSNNSPYARHRKVVREQVFRASSVSASRKGKILPRGCTPAIMVAPQMADKRIVSPNVYPT